MMFPIPRILLIIYLALGSVISTGILFGWPSLVIILKDEGVFSQLCGNTTLNVTDILVSNTTSIYPTCTEQEFQFSLAFIIGTLSLYSAQCLTGFALDYAGPKILHVICGLGVSVASVLLICTVYSIIVNLII